MERHAESPFNLSHVLRDFHASIFFSYSLRQSSRLHKYFFFLLFLSGRRTASWPASSLLHCHSSGRVVAWCASSSYPGERIEGKRHNFLLFPIQDHRFETLSRISNLKIYQEAAHWTWADNYQNWVRWFVESSGRRSCCWTETFKPQIVFPTKEATWNQTQGSRTLNLSG